MTELGKWVRGSTRFTSSFEGVVYRFPTAEAKATFDADPAHFVPVLNGDSVVAYADSGRRVPGGIRFAARSRATKRVYLFANGREKAAFLADPDTFAEFERVAVSRTKGSP